MTVASTGVAAAIAITVVLLKVVSTGFFYKSSVFIFDTGHQKVVSTLRNYISNK